MSAPVVSYFFAPVFTLMEEGLKGEVRRLVGWAEGDGIFCPGDAFANLMALRMALHHAHPCLRDSGFSAFPHKPAIFLSVDADANWENAAAITGKKELGPGTEICSWALFLS
jgi:glutamate/tyrosine decarboxylase-like PLP-dependent enzyme